MNLSALVSVILMVVCATLAVLAYLAVPAALFLAVDRGNPAPILGALYALVLGSVMVADAIICYQMWREEVS